VAGVDSGGLNLNKVVLTPERPLVSLAKGRVEAGELRVNLNWNPRPLGAGGRGAIPVDLDLGCLYQLANGRKGAVQALGNLFGAFDKPPYVALDTDDRSGRRTEGENLRINLAHAAEIRRLLVYAFLYEGIARFEEADGVATLYPVRGPAIEVRLDERAGTARMCAIALIENTGGELLIRREVNFIEGGQSALDRAYDWGLRWMRGSK
jgi:tellurite resistance protein TerA